MSLKIKRGDIVDVKITGIQPYGAFASLPDNSTGLIHISEISDKFVKSIDSFVKVGEFIKVKIKYEHTILPLFTMKIYRLVLKYSIDE